MSQDPSWIDLQLAKHKLPGSNGYQIENWIVKGTPLGVGAFGATFVATQRLKTIPGISKRAALKIFNSTSVDSGTLVTTFSQEVAALSKIDSRFIANLLDAGVASGFPWIVTDLIDGTSLDSRTKKGTALQLQDWLSLASCTLTGLGSAHDVGLSHLDIKPANIMFSKTDSTYVLVDFGIAKTSMLYSIRSKSIAGTLFYLAPEAFRGEYSQASDIFSLGSTLFEAATGQNPWLELAKNLGLPKEMPWAQKYAIALRAKPNWDSLPQQTLSLVKLMMSIDPSARPPARVCQDILREIQPPTTRSTLQTEIVGKTTDALAIFESWRSLQQRIEDSIQRTGLANFKLDVFIASEPNIAFRTKEFQDYWRFSCNVPSQPKYLLAMGWKPVEERPLLYKKLEKPTDPRTAAAVVVQALESGYGVNLSEIRLA